MAATRIKPNLNSINGTVVVNNKIENSNDRVGSLAEVPVNLYFTSDNRQTIQTFIGNAANGIAEKPESYIRNRTNRAACELNIYEERPWRDTNDRCFDNPAEGKLAQLNCSRHVQSFLNLFSEWNQPV
jgi:hypothetical protein